MTPPLTFERFSEINRRRCESYNGFGESLQPDGKWKVEHWAMFLCSEAGEICDAILGWQGLKERRKDKTKEDVGEEIADAVIILDLLASKLGFSLADLIVAKFNKVTLRSDFPARFLINDDKSAPTPTGASQGSGGDKERP